MAKEILFGVDGREKIARGVEKLANAVKTTLGPCGRNVIIKSEFGAPIITKDGVTVSKQVVLKDPFEDVGAQMINEVAHKTGDVAGDGTTTATVLAEAIYKEGHKYVVSGANPMELKQGIDLAVKEIVGGIEASSIPVRGKDDMTDIATVSANNDIEIGKQIAEAMEAVGRDGVVTVEETEGIENSMEVVKGLSFDRGSISSHFFTDKEKMEAVLVNPNIILYDKSISSIKSLLPLLESSAKSGKSLLIIAEDIVGDALTTLVVNKMRGNLDVVAVKAPGFGDSKTRMLQDIATVTGGRVISEEVGRSLESVTSDDLGSAKKVVVLKDSTVIVDGSGIKTDIDVRVSQLKKELEEVESSYDKEKLKERIAKLTGGVAVIKVGAASEIEMKEKKYRIEDALHATRAAMESGVVPGGGLALFRATTYLKDLNVSGDKELGVRIVFKALEAPLRAIVENSGCEGSVIVNEIRLKGSDIGFNARTGKLSHLMVDGIKDPAKVVIVALQNAASIAGLLLTTECIIIEEETKKDNTFSPGAPGMGMSPMGH